MLFAKPVRKDKCDGNCLAWELRLKDWGPQMDAGFLGAKGTRKMHSAGILSLHLFLLRLNCVALLAWPVVPFHKNCAECRQVF